MQNQLLLSIIFNFIFYVIIGIMLFKIMVTPTDKPLPKNEIIPFRNFCKVLAVIWPVTLIYLATEGTVRR